MESELTEGPVDGASPACTGCGACVEVCSRGALVLRPDQEGFLRPLLDVEKCVKCGRCGRVCPVLCGSVERQPLSCYAATSADAEARAQSSSGGLFSALAEGVLADGGLVFGARFDGDYNVCLAGTDSRDGLDALRRSKYVQAAPGNAYREALEALRSGRRVLFCATPCQVAALLALAPDGCRERLLAVQLLCHGVPSPGLWTRYLDEEARRQGRDGAADLRSVNFRHKLWRESPPGDNNDHAYAYAYAYAFAFALDGKPLLRSAYLEAFLNNATLRPSCHCCHFRGLRTGADLLIGDLWQGEEICGDFYRGLETSSVVVATRRGATALEATQCQRVEIPYEWLLHHSVALAGDACPHPRRGRLFGKLGGAESVIGLLEEVLRPSLCERLRGWAWGVKRWLMGSGGLKAKCPKS